MDAPVRGNIVIKVEAFSVLPFLPKLPSLEHLGDAARLNIAAREVYQRLQRGNRRDYGHFLDGK